MVTTEAGVSQVRHAHTCSCVLTLTLIVPIRPEPPELLMYTPEKSRKSLPLLLEGNLPYRRIRRQSGEILMILQPSRTGHAPLTTMFYSAAPAKDIETVFNPEGENVETLFSEVSR